jgi:hypothetical protein
MNGWHFARSVHSTLGIDSRHTVAEVLTLRFRWRRKRLPEMYAAAASNTAAMPPTTPPTMAPAFPCLLFKYTCLSHCTCKRLPSHWEDEHLEQMHHKRFKKPSILQLEVGYTIAKHTGVTWWRSNVNSCISPRL